MQLLWIAYPRHKINWHTSVWMQLIIRLSLNALWQHWWTTILRAGLEVEKNKCWYDSFVFLPLLLSSSHYFVQWLTQTSATSCLNVRKLPAKHTGMSFLRKKCLCAFQSAKAVLVYYTNPYRPTSSPDWGLSESAELSWSADLFSQASVAFNVIWMNL